MSVFNNFSKPPGQHVPGPSAGNMPGFQHSSQSHSSHQPPHTSVPFTPKATVSQPQSSQNQQTQALPQATIEETSDIEKLRKLKESILAGQHPFFKAVPNPDALASLWLGPYPASQAAKNQITQQEKSVQPETGLLAQPQLQMEGKGSPTLEKSTTDSQNVTLTSTVTATRPQAISSSVGPNGSTEALRPEILRKGSSVDISSKIQDSLPTAVQSSDASGILSVSGQPPSKPPPPGHDSKDPGVYKYGGYDRDKDRERERSGYSLYDSRYEPARRPYSPDHRDPKRDLVRFSRYNDPGFFDRDREWNRDRDLSDRELERESDRLREREREYERSRHLVERRSLPSSITALEPRSVSTASSRTSLSGSQTDVPPHPEQRPMTTPSLIDQHHQDPPAHNAKPLAIAEHKPQVEQFLQEPILLPRSDVQPPHTESRQQTTPFITSVTGRTDSSVETSASRPVPPVSEPHCTNSAVAAHVPPPERDQQLDVPQVVTAPSKMEPPARIQQLSVPPVPLPTVTTDEHRTVSIEQGTTPIAQPVPPPPAPIEQRPEPIAATDRSSHGGTSVPSFDTTFAHATSTEMAPRNVLPSDAHAGASARHAERDNARSYYPAGPEPRSATRRSTSPRRPPELPYDGTRERISTSSSLPYRELSLGVPPSSAAARIYTEEPVRPHLGSAAPHRPESYFSPLPSSAGPDRREEARHWRERNEYPGSQYPGVDEKERLRRYAETREWYSNNVYGRRKRDLDIELHPRSRPPPASWDRERPDYETWDRKHPGPPNWDPGYDDRFIPRHVARYAPTPDLPPRDPYRENPRVRPRSPSPPGRPVGIYDDAHRTPKRIREDYDRPPYFDDRRAEYPGRIPSPGYFDPRAPTISSREPLPYGRERAVDPFRRDMPPPRSPPPFYPPPRDRYPPR